ncbi:MAG TPA: macro domain-containing protein [Longimicrobiaceae bacterium]|nr:macro domain-containing protein [Longimicrobiaceae bacterium]
MIRNILEEKGRYGVWLGAGASAEAGVSMGNEICERIREKLLQTSGVDPGDVHAVAAWADEKLSWSNPGRRYLQCIRAAYPNPPKRVEYFRRLLRDRRPAFCHYATALLMAHGYIRRTCLTTNFDHLLEAALTELGLLPFQVIRTPADALFWQERDDRGFVVKLHGDIDTENILNTREETISIAEQLRLIVRETSRGAGLVVLGAAGHEKSVHNLFDEVGREGGRILEFGLLWGVYMGERPPTSISEEELQREVVKRAREQVNSDVLDVISDSKNALFALFPIWGTGAFLRDVIEASGNRSIRGEAAPHFDHEMRLRTVFAGAGLDDVAVDRHLDALRIQRRELLERPAAQVGVPENVLSARTADGVVLRVIYGDIASRRMMASGEPFRRALVSPEDTFISAGGGVAYQILRKAGASAMLHELAKFAPVEQGEVAVTSAGKLPLHYVFHAAAVRIDPSGVYQVDREDVRRTMGSVLRLAAALDVTFVLVPLLGAGVASLQPRESLEGIFQALAAYAAGGGSPLTVSVVIYREAVLPRHEVQACFTSVLDAQFVPEPLSSLA